MRLAAAEDWRMGVVWQGGLRASPKYEMLPEPIESKQMYRDFSDLPPGMNKMIERPNLKRKLTRTSEVAGFPLNCTTNFAFRSGAGLRWARHECRTSRSPCEHSGRRNCWVSSPNKNAGS